MKDKIKSAVTDKAKSLAKGIFNFPQIDSDIEVWFIFEGKEYEVNQFNIAFRQSVDYKGQPQEEVRGGRIILQLTQTLPDNIYRWAMTSCLRSGSVEFRSKTSSAPLKVEFAEAFCLSFKRVVDSSGGVKTSITISPNEILINGLDFYNNWTGI